MNTLDDKTRSTAMLISSVLFRSFILGFCVLILAAIALVSLMDLIYALVSIFVDMPQPDFVAMMLGGLFQMRILLFVFFLFPAIAIRWALRSPHWRPAGE